MNITSRSRSLHSGIAGWLTPSSILRSSTRILCRAGGRFISHVRWELEFIWSAVTTNQVVVFAYLRHMQSQIRSHSSGTSYKFALRHTSMRRSHLFSKRPNSKSSDLHMLAKAFRANSRSRSTFLDSRRSLTHFQSAGAAKSISPPICLAVGPHRPSRELRAVGYPWKSLSWGSTDLKKPQKLFVFRISHYWSLSEGVTTLKEF